MLSSCSTANTQCAFQSYRSQYTTPKYVNEKYKPKRSKRLTAITKRMLSSIQVNGKNLLLQRQANTKLRYGPVPFKVDKVQGTQITATRGDRVRKRDAKKFTKIHTSPPANYRKNRYPIVEYCDMFLTFDSYQPAKISNGMDTTGQESVSSPESPQNFQMTPIARPRAPQ